MPTTPLLAGSFPILETVHCLDRQELPCSSKKIDRSGKDLVFSCEPVMLTRARPAARAS